MKIPLQLLLALAASAPAAALAGSAPDIGSPASRADVVGFARGVLDARAVPPVPPAAAALTDPFNPAAPAAARTAPDDVAAPPDDYVLLQSMAALVNPDGSLSFDGESYLVVDRRRYKTGDSIPVLFGGRQYQLQLVRIRGNTFTLRLNGTEITRPIQQSSSKP